MRCHWFRAQAEGPKGYYAAWQSDDFYCPDWEPDSEYAGQEHDTLVRQLVKQGWEPSGERLACWWNLRFRRLIQVAELLP